MSRGKNSQVTREQAAGLPVAEAMLASPKALPADSTIADLRLAFENSHLRTALLVDGSDFLGVVQRDSLPTEVGMDHLPAGEIANRDVPTVTPETPLSEALRIMDERGDKRLPVLDPDGRTLRGLLCLTSDREGFCR